MTHDAHPFLLDGPATPPGASVHDRATERGTPPGRVTTAGVPPHRITGSTGEDTRTGTSASAAARGSRPSGPGRRQR